MEKTIGTQYSPSNDSALRSVNQAGTAMHDSTDKLAESARATVDRVAAAAHSTVDKLAGSASSVAGQAHYLKDVPLQAVDYSKAYIKDHPLQAVGAALLLGLIFGRLTANRN